MWIAYAFGSALFAGLTSILAKCGIKQTDSNAATALRTLVVLVFSWLMVLVTGASWLCYYKALKDGLASVVVPIDKLSILVTIVFSYVVNPTEKEVRTSVLTSFLAIIITERSILKRLPCVKGAGTLHSQTPPLCKGRWRKAPEGLSGEHRA